MAKPKSIPAELLSDMEFQQRFWSKVDVSSDCWRWTGHTQQGYGTTRYRAFGQFRVHRLAYFMKVGQVPDGLTLDHLCRNRSCCNPAHLEAVTDKDNVLRGTGSPAQNARKTHCKRGHPLEEGRIRTRGRKAERWCRECERRRKRKKTLAPQCTAERYAAGVHLGRCLKRTLHQSGFCGWHCTPDVHASHCLVLCTSSPAGTVED